MALPINKFEVFDVGKPHVGCKQPSRVRGKITVTLNVRGSIRAEWDGEAATESPLEKVDNWLFHCQVFGNTTFASLLRSDR